MRNIVQKSLTYFNTKKFKDKVFKDLHKNRVVFIKQDWAPLSKTSLMQLLNYNSFSQQDMKLI